MEDGKGLRCPHCRSGRSKVLDKQDIFDGAGRKRQCLDCGRYFLTAERVRLKKSSG